MKLKSVKSQLCPDYGFIWALQHENSVESVFEVQNIKKGDSGPVEKVIISDKIFY